MPNHLLLLGTMKGAFAFTSNSDRKQWTLSEPGLPGWEVSALHITPNGGRIYAGTNHWSYGATIRVSDDGGKSWKEMLGRPQHAEKSGYKMNRIWQLVGHPTDPNTVYAGVDEAALFVTHDRGDSWEEVTGLTSRPERPHWQPGGGGLCLHTILIDPKNPNRMWVAISAAGFFRTTDGGKTWDHCVKGLPGMETGNADLQKCYCVHKVVLDPTNADNLFLQFHGGVFKSTNGGDSWEKIESGLPSNFGFPMVVTKKGELFIAPLESDQQRLMPEGKLRIYSSKNAGSSWNPTNQGLPENHYVGVLRDAMTVDSSDPAGIYFGTTMGDAWLSTNSGESWQNLPGKFPRIESVRIASW